MDIKLKFFKTTIFSTHKMGRYYNGMISGKYWKTNK